MCPHIPVFSDLYRAQPGLTMSIFTNELALGFYTWVLALLCLGNQLNSEEP